MKKNFLYAPNLTASACSPSFQKEAAMLLKAASHRREGRSDERTGATKSAQPHSGSEPADLAGARQRAGQFKMLLHLIAHPWPHTCHDLREHTGLSKALFGTSSTP